VQAQLEQQTVTPAKPRKLDLDRTEVFRLGTPSTYVFATLPEAQALRLHGCRARFRVEPSAGPWNHYGQVVRECAGLAPLRRTLWLSPGEDLDGPATVEAVLKVVRHAAWSKARACTELRLIGARVLL